VTRSPGPYPNPRKNFGDPMVSRCYATPTTSAATCDSTGLSGTDTDTAQIEAEDTPAHPTEAVAGTPSDQPLRPNPYRIVGADGRLRPDEPTLGHERDAWAWLWSPDPDNTPGGDHYPPWWTQPTDDHGPDWLLNLIIGAAQDAGRAWGESCEHDGIMLETGSDAWESLVDPRWFLAWLRERPNAELCEWVFRYLRLRERWWGDNDAAYVGLTGTEPLIAPDLGERIPAPPGGWEALAHLVTNLNRAPIDREQAIHSAYRGLVIATTGPALREVYRSARDAGVWSTELEQVGRARWEQIKAVAA
jgi:hypothetical protein